MTEVDSPRKGWGRRRSDGEGSGAGFRGFRALLPVGLLFVLLSLYSNSQALSLSKSIVAASDASDVAHMAAVTEQMKDQENEISSLRSRITKFEKDLEQVLDETRKLGMVARPQQLLAKSEGEPTRDLEALIPNTPKLSSMSNSSEPWAALVAVLRDEERYIDEWVDYHLALGFREIHLVDCHPNRTLAEWGKTAPPGVFVTSLEDMPIDPQGNGVQEQTYDMAVKRLRTLKNPPRWVMISDGDEFLVFRDGSYDNVNDFFSDHVKSGSLQISLLIFGTSNQTAYRDEPVTKRFQYRMATPHINTKLVVVLDHLEKVTSPHYVQLKDGYKRRGMGGAKVGMGGALCCIDPRKSKTSVAAFHHYKTKSEEEFNFKNCVRGRNNRNAKRHCGAKPQVGEVFDDTAWQFLKNHVPKYAALTTSIPLIL
jgi:hypothetical protein